MKKTFVLDTSVLLHDPQALFYFEDNDVVIPIAVIEEIDGHKRKSDQIGRSARMVSRYLDELRSKGHLNEGVDNGQGGMLKIELNHQELEGLPFGLDRVKNDNRILAVALSLQKDERCQKPVILVSKDINMRVKADALGLLAEDYETNKVNIDELYPGFETVLVAPEKVNEFYQQGWLSLADLGGRYYANQFIMLQDNAGQSQTALGRVDVGQKRLLPLRHPNADLSGIRARNREQKFAIEALLDDDIQLVTLVGQAGTGKTLLALAAGIEKVLEEKKYRKLLVTRPVVPLGNDIGFLPGDVEEKLRPWMQPLYDNLELIFGNRDRQEKLDAYINHLQDLDILDIEALTYIRGRSIPGQYFILDEAQNLTPHEVKTVITRVGEGTKIVLTGDPYQIDNPYLDANSNGLTYVVERFKDYQGAAHITLTKGERSALAEMAAELL
ncbi:MAG: PhoH family protein [Firmicutes bacterium]|nr:PhoH family protein [Bacillota bacterium]